jgi:hypothetical protein
MKMYTEAAQTAHDNLLPLVDAAIGGFQPSCPNDCV